MINLLSQTVLNHFYCFDAVKIVPHPLLLAADNLMNVFIRLRPVHRLQPGNHILHSRQLLPQPVTDGSG